VHHNWCLFVKAIVQRRLITEKPELHKICINKHQLNEILRNDTDLSIPRHLHSLQFGFPCSWISGHNGRSTLKHLNHTFSVTSQQVPIRYAVCKKAKFFPQSIRGGINLHFHSTHPHISFLYETANTPWNYCLLITLQSIHWYSMQLPKNGWPGWVDLGGWLHTNSSTWFTCL